MSIDYQVFSDVRNVALGGVSLHGVRRITLGRRRAEVRAVGDGETFESVARGAACAVRGTVDLVDPVQAGAALGAAGNLVFTWRDARGGTDRVVTVVGVSVTGVEQRGGFRKPAGASMAFAVQSADGVTDPVSVT